MKFLHGFCSTMGIAVLVFSMVIGTALGAIANPWCTDAVPACSTTPPVLTPVAGVFSCAAGVCGPPAPGGPFTSCGCEPVQQAVTGIWVCSCQGS